MAQTIRPFLHDAGAAAEEADAIAVACTKSLLLQIRLWSRAYVGDAEWSRVSRRRKARLPTGLTK